MNNNETFIINEGVLRSYNGKEDLVIVPDDVKVIEGKAFYRIKNRKIVLPEGLQIIGYGLNGAFYQCSDLDIVFPSSVEYIDKNAFNNCSNIRISCNAKVYKLLGKNIRDQMSIQWLYDTYHFDEAVEKEIASSLKRNGFKLVEFMDTDSETAITRLLNNTSFSLEQLEQVMSIAEKREFKDMVKVLLDYKNSHFENDSQRKEDKLLSLDDETDYSKIFNWEINNDKITITKCKSISPTIQVPPYIEGKPVYAIGKNAFKGKKTVHTIELPETLEAIEDSAFEDCTSLEKCVLPSSLKTIGKRAFYNCVPYIFSVEEFKENVVLIDSNAFSAKDPIMFDAPITTRYIRGRKTKISTKGSNFYGDTLYILHNSVADKKKEELIDWLNVNIKYID